MIKKFVRRNWIYIVLFCLIVAMNVMPRLEKDRTQHATPSETASETIVAEEDDALTLFVDFEEAQRRSKRVEEILKKNLSLYLFYISFNILIVVIFLLGLSIDGYVLASTFRRKSVIQKVREIKAPSWSIGDVFRIIILALTFGYIFFIIFGFFVGLLETVMKTKFTFYKNENFRMTFDTIVLDVIVFMVILRFMRAIYKEKLASLGFMKRHMKRNIFYGVCGYIGVIPIVFIFGIFVYIILNFFKIKPPPQPIVELFLVEKNIGLIFISSAIAAIFGPVIEEIFFRGVMYNAVKKRLGIFWSILMTSVLFSFLHTHAMTYFLVGFIPITILGMVLAYLYEKTGSLIPSITLHILNNIGSVFMVFMFKYFNSLVG